MPRKLKTKAKSALTITVLSILVITGFLLLISNPSYWFIKSIHGDAKKYTTKHCMVFYPDSKLGKQKAKEICRDHKDDRIYDYSLVPYGDYYLVNYGSGISYFTDKSFNEIVINDIDDDGKRIISDYLRYQIKKDKPDIYYTKQFLESSSADKLNFDNVTYDIYSEYLKCSFSDYDIDVFVPLRHIQESLGMNFGYPDEMYVKPTYIDTSGKHPIICLTFDDGPQLWAEKDESSTVKIVNSLYKYDACGTFFVCGYCLEERTSWTDFEVYSFLKEMVSNGNEFGSHTMDHDYLPDLTAEEITKTLKAPADYLEDLLGYHVSLYRPVEGAFNFDINNASPYPAILWSDDSHDWEYENGDEIYEYIMSRAYYDGDVIIMHDIYDETADAVEKVVPALIEKGYQLLTVSDMLVGEGIDKGTLSYYYNLNPSPYYE